MVQLIVKSMELARSLLFDVLNDYKNYMYDFYPKFQFGFNSYKNVLYKSKQEFYDDATIKIDLPYIDLDKLKSYIENGYLFIKYNNPDDVRRKTYEYVVYVGDEDVKIKYENGFLIIEREKTKPERKIITISSN
ncbi:MAG: hypothetical protein NZZ41_02650 [Candidatus Dojkabacteria bacterium]|nr:hypothetical protein [Candidatus Dojkabacteria bacterium]